MKKINVPTLEQLDTDSQHTLNLLSKRLGSIPNLYATIGYSSKALNGLLNFEAALMDEAVFSAKDREAVNLIVSEVNHCDYCLAAHTLLAMKRGFTKEETLAIRRGELENEKLNVVLLLSRSISENKGYADQALLEAFFDAGYNESALMELIGLITIRTFTNYVYALTDIPIDFPPAPAQYS